MAGSAALCALAFRQILPNVEPKPRINAVKSWGFRNSGRYTVRQENRLFGTWKTGLKSVILGRDA